MTNRSIFLNAPDDVAWVREVHLPKDAPAFGSFVLFGNEDAPEKVICYADANPNWDAAPVITFLPAGGTRP